MAARASLSLQQVDLGLQHALRFAGAVVLGVFAQVAFGPGGRDPLFDLRHLLVFELVDLGLDLVVPGAGHGDAFGHGGTSARFERERKKNGLLGETCYEALFSVRAGAECKE